MFGRDKKKRGKKKNFDSDLMFEELPQILKDVGGC